MRRLAAFVLIVLLACGCRAPDDIGSTERGLRYNALPAILGGGLDNVLAQPGKLFLFPWQRLYVVDVAEHTLVFGPPAKESALEAFSSDGSKFSLSATLRYRVRDTAEAVASLLNGIGGDRAALEEILALYVRDGALRRCGSASSSELARAAVRSGLERDIAEDLRGSAEGVGVEVIGFQIGEERMLGMAGENYRRSVTARQGLDEEIRAVEDTLRAAAADGARALGEAKAAAQLELSRAEAASKQAAGDADSYYEVKQREAAALTEAGRLDLEGLKERIQALAGPGGRAVLKLEIAKRLRESGATFVVLDGKSAAPAKELLEQLGRAGREPAAAAAEPAVQPAPAQ